MEQNCLSIVKKKKKIVRQYFECCNCFKYCMSVIDVIYTFHAEEVFLIQKLVLVTADF